MTSVRHRNGFIKNIPEVFKLLTNTDKSYHHKEKTYCPSDPHPRGPPPEKSPQESPRKPAHPHGNPRPARGSLNFSGKTLYLLT